MSWKCDLLEPSLIDWLYKNAFLDWKCSFLEASHKLPLQVAESPFSSTAYIWDWTVIPGYNSKCKPIGELTPGVIAVKCYTRWNSVIRAWRSSDSLPLCSPWKHITKVRQQQWQYKCFWLAKGKSADDILPLGLDWRDKSLPVFCYCS